MEHGVPDIRSRKPKTSGISHTPEEGYTPTPDPRFNKSKTSGISYTPPPKDKDGD